jgi:hypothetical protein
VSSGKKQNTEIENRNTEIGKPKQKAEIHTKTKTEIHFNF